jgi:hypothetical protein
MIGRIVPLLWLMALITAGGCTRREMLAIAPATMGTTASRHNHPEGAGYVLIEKATLSARVKFRSVHRWGLRITAHAAPAADGAWPQLGVGIDREPARTVLVRTRRPMSYWVNFSAEPGISELSLTFLNPGPYLVIDRIEIVPL